MSPFQTGKMPPKANDHCSAVSIFSRKNVGYEFVEERESKETAPQKGHMRQNRPETADFFVVRSQLRNRGLFGI